MPYHNESFLWHLGIKRYPHEERTSVEGEDDQPNSKYSCTYDKNVIDEMARHDSALPSDIALWAEHKANAGPG